MARINEHNILQSNHGDSAVSEEPMHSGSPAISQIGTMESKRDSANQRFVYLVAET